MRSDDFDAVVRIDEKITHAARHSYYQVKFETCVQSADHLPVSLVAETDDGTVVGFVMGVLFIGEYGITQERATLDTIGVDPDHQRQGIGRLLLNEFMDHLRSLGVTAVSTLVDVDDANLTRLFETNQFKPSRIVNLERSL